MHDYQRLRVWRASCDLAVLVYRITQSFPRAELFGMTSQLRRSATSIAANIAEGAGRGTPRDFARYLRMAAGSASEFETHLIISESVGLLSAVDARDARSSVANIKGMLHRLESTLVPGT